MPPRPIIFWMRYLPTVAPGSNSLARLLSESVFGPDPAGAGLSLSIGDGDLSGISGLSPAGGFDLRDTASSPSSNFLEDLDFLSESIVDCRCLAAVVYPLQKVSNIIAYIPKANKVYLGFD